LADYILLISYIVRMYQFFILFYGYMFFLSICVAVIFILFWICTKIRFTSFKSFFCIYFDEKL